MKQDLKFTPVHELINCEGTVLALVEDPANEGHLYIQGLCLNNNTKLYAKVIDSALQLYLHGRITLRELFSLRGDEAYLLPGENGLVAVYIEDEESSKIMSSIKYGESFYPAIAAAMRCNHSVDEILRHLKSDWVRGVAEVIEGRLTENNYLKS